MRLVVLASGSGSNLQALIDAIHRDELPVQILAVGSDRPGTYALERSAAAGLETFVVDYRSFPDRAAWDAALLEAVLGFQPDYVLSSGFMRIVGADFIGAFPRRYLNTHPALLPAFPGAHGVRDALAYGVKVTGCTVMYADEGVDTGPIIAQRAIDVLPEDDETSLHERIKAAERELLIQVLRDLAAQ
ncbi:phosphoribosylglycinamide formyltransferase [Acaricomes phytoseiuli]|uniref:phosphoribosylglycinamide formyltransferase n=1 Tax=Acaricomes phytoseiuli TaxID=291968 RepID=UPI00037BD88C|nr:phosphoribosylglycinamide formyltransferase [Acaricomes phytoseiuli]MCW1249962.1 phosphoribosylglycinamide formyltransferase [Acaricomes phytoseiuli]